MSLLSWRHKSNSIAEEIWHLKLRLDIIITIFDVSFRWKSGETFVAYAVNDVNNMEDEEEEKKK